jgi:DNA-binding Xre family transcriptional regulator
LITPLQAIANSKGWTFEALAKRWEVSPRQLSRIAAAGKRRDIDVVNGLPDISKRTYEEKIS